MVMKPELILLLLVVFVKKKIVIHNFLQCYQKKYSILIEQP